MVALVESSAAQNKTLQGKVLDSATHAPLQNVSITIKNSSGGGLTNADGRFSIIADKNARSISFSFTGYHGETRLLSNDPRQEFTILLSRSYTILDDVFVNAKRGKYHNKNNPAVDLVRRVIEHKSENSPDAFPYASYEKYEKVRMFTDGPWDFVTRNFALKNCISFLRIPTLR